TSGRGRICGTAQITACAASDAGDTGVFRCRPQVSAVATLTAMPIAPAADRQDSNDRSLQKIKIRKESRRPVRPDKDSDVPPVHDRSVEGPQLRLVAPCESNESRSGTAASKFHSSHWR